jgi:hypothetical protein
MKLLFTLLILVSCLAVRGQEYRDYSDSTGRYLVRYDINKNGLVMVPAVLIFNEDGSESGGAPHYDAWVTVYEIKIKSFAKQTINAVTTLPKVDTVIIGKMFRGQYVEGGCFEDRPEDMVNHAKLLQSEMKKPKR